MPNVGDILTDTATVQETLYLLKEFASAKIYLKNRNGTWAKGSTSKTQRTFIEEIPANP